MKRLGFLICTAGSVAAILIPPYKLAGIGDPRWGFIFDDIAAAFGQHIRIYDHLDVQTLLMELIAINLAGVALILVGRK
jgi:hypothetical protein